LHVVAADVVRLEHGAVGVPGHGHGEGVVTIKAQVDGPISDIPSQIPHPHP
jgi:hypothetical protein